MPITGYILAELLSFMTSPYERLAFFAKMNEFAVQNPNDAGREYLEYNMNFYSIIMGFVALCAGVASMIQKLSFGHLGENTTFEIRKKMYNSLMRKNIGWFDNKDNGVSVVTSAMAQDTSIINGVSTESLAPQCEGIFALVVGLLIGFYACWEMALICLGLSPIMAIGNALGIKLTSGLVGEQNELQKDANLLCGDAISNFKTVQSLGNVELVVKKYEELLEPAYKVAINS
jgi:ATP-binding cassette subfamily B (MDR/TAP) protein 1